MARTSKKTKAVTVATVAEAATDAEIRTVGDVLANVTAARPVPETVPASGETVFIPLNRLKKSPRNARKTPHTEAEIEAYAASIAAKGMFQNLVVEPEQDADGQPTGFYLVTIGEGRRLAQLLRAKRKEIKKAEAIRCVIDTANDPFEISLDENVTRTAMSPADQFEAFRELSVNRGWGAEDIAARFGVSAHVVKQRLRLGAVSPRLMQVYRDGGLTLDQLMAFAITEDHARQEQVYEGLGYNKEPWIIRRDLTKTNVAATDRRAIFVGPEAYSEAGGTIIRDLFTEDRGGFYEDAALLDKLVIEKLESIAQQVQEAEGWKWVDVHIDYPHGNGMRRSYPQPIDLSEEDEATYAAAKDEYDRLTAAWEGTDEDLPPDVDERFAELEAEIEGIDALRHAYDPDEIVRGGVFVVLSHDGEARIERGFIRAEDEALEPEEAEDDEGALDAHGADLSWSRHQGTHRRRRARSRWRRGSGSDRLHEEAADGRSRRAASWRNRLAPAALAHRAACLAGRAAGRRRGGSAGSGRAGSSGTPRRGGDGPRRRRRRRGRGRRSLPARSRVNRHGRSRFGGSGQLPNDARKLPAAPGAAGDLDDTTAGTRAMRSYSEQRARLARMEAARAETERHLAVIERQIEVRAERMTTSTRVEARQFGRGTATWTRADERELQANVAALRFKRRGEIEALTGKLTRQTGAIAAFRVRHRINEPEREAVS